MARPKNVYRGKRRWRWVITLLALILVLALVLGAWLFSYMQRFVVYDRDGLRLVLPFEREETSDSGGDSYTAPAVDAEITVEKPTFDGLSLGAGESLSEIHALYVPAASVKADTLKSYASALPATEYNALLIQLKTPEGYLSYKSSVALADSYGVNGTENIAEALYALEQAGIYLAAEICTLRDDAMATRNTPIALKTSSGEVVTDSAGSWLDPYSEGTRDYYAALFAELDHLGFSEVVLTGLEYPDAQDVAFSLTLGGETDKVSCISTFCVRMSRAARESGLACSGFCSDAALRAGTSADMGQDLSLFFKAFDRVYVRTDTEYRAVDVRSLSPYSGDADTRVVPVYYGAGAGSGSWCVMK